MEQRPFHSVTVRRFSPPPLRQVLLLTSVKRGGVTFMSVSLLLVKVVLLLGCFLPLSLEIRSDKRVMLTTILFFASFSLQGNCIQ